MEKKHHHDHQPSTCVRVGGGTQTLSVPAVGSGGGPRCWFLPEPMYNVTDKEVDHSSLFFLWQFLQCRCHRNLDAWSFALNLSLTPTPTFISSHETPPSRILQAYCEEPSMKAASRHSRLGADAMPCQLKVTSLVQQLWWQWKEKPVKGRRIGGVGEGEGCPKWKQAYEY
uniref:Uncharacterized protein n=1 Tax=Salix viminalis TaxID=40686 RepID=A0A6N2KY03_SALVM